LLVLEGVNVETQKQKIVRKSCDGKLCGWQIESTVYRAGGIAYRVGGKARKGTRISATRARK